MMLEQVKLKTRGVGGSVALALLILPSIAGFFLIARKTAHMRLRNTPQVRLFGRVPFGSSFLWGYLLVGIGTCLSMGYFFGSEDKSEDLWIFLLCCLPVFLTGGWLVVYWALYRSYKQLAEQTLRQIAINPVLEVSQSVNIEGLNWTVAEQVRLLDDLCDNDLILYQALDEHRYSVRVIHPDLQFYCREARQSVPSEAWTCTMCGAANNTAPGIPCEYCGAVPEAARK